MDAASPLQHFAPAATCDLREIYISTRENRPCSGKKGASQA